MLPCWLISGFLLLVVASSSDGKIRMPPEWERHERVFMAWPNSAEIWKDGLLPLVRKDIAGIANAIVKYEEVVMLVDESDEATAKELLDAKVKIVQMAVDDLWARDTLPVFVTDVEDSKETLVGVDFNFNGWGDKQNHTNDALIARKVLEKYNVKREASWIVGEGGSLETDGRGTLMVTLSSLVNDNRNGNKTSDEIEDELKRVLGVSKVIWFDGVYDEDITDAHVDCVVRFVKPGVVVLNRPFPGSPPDVWSKSSDQALSVLQNETDADGNKFKVFEIFEPDPEKVAIAPNGNPNEFVASYVNFYIGNGVVILPEFGDAEADLKAQETMKEVYPERTIVPVKVSALASGGGGIHCATHDMPAV